MFVYFFSIISINWTNCSICFFFLEKLLQLDRNISFVPLFDNEAVCLAPASMKKTICRIKPCWLTFLEDFGRNMPRSSQICSPTFVVPKCCKAITVIPVPEKPHVSRYNGYRTTEPICIIQCFDHQGLRVVSKCPLRSGPLLHHPQVEILQVRVTNRPKRRIQ